MKSFNTALLCLLFGTVSAQLPLEKIRSVGTVSAVDDKAFFSATDIGGMYGEELWISDGSPDGTRLVKDINPGWEQSSPQQLTSFKGKLFFTAHSPQYGQELWTSDGTAEGTAIVKDLAQGTEGSDPRYLTVFKDFLYFRTSQGGFYKTDGTAAGTILLEEDQYYAVNGIKVGGNFLYYTTYRPDGFKRTDGTTVTPIPYPESSEDDLYFHSLHVADDRLFVVMTSQYQQILELYAYDENAASWSLLKNFHAPLYGDHEIANFTTVGTQLFFSLRADYENQPKTDQLWVSDGTVEGTLPLRSTTWTSSYTGNAAEDFIEYNGMLYFRSGYGDANALWRSDGTVEGTVKIHDVRISRANPYSSNPPAVSNGLLWFCGGTGEYSEDAELWSSDGTTAGTKEYCDLNAKGSSSPYLLTDANGTLFFIVGDSYTGTTLWSNVPASDLNVLTVGDSPVPSGESLYLNHPNNSSCIKLPIILFNAGHRELALSDVVVTGSEFYLKGALPEILNPNEKVSIDLFFRPFSAGKKTGELIVHSNDQGQPSYTIKLVGEMTAADIRLACQDFNQELVKSIKATPAVKKITLSKSMVEENLAPLTPVGSFTLPGSSGPVTYTLTNGTGDTNNNHFTIQGNQLLTTKKFEYAEKHLYTVRVKATDVVTSVEEIFVISIIDGPAALVDEDCQPALESLNYGYTDTEFNSVGELFAITNTGRILRSKNEGVNWEFLNNGYWGRLNRIFFKGDKGYIVGERVLLKSDDNGASWFQLYLPFDYNYIGNVTAFFFDASRGYVTGGDGYVFFTSDGGRSWDLRMKGHYSEAVRDPWFFDENNGLAFMGGAILAKTADGGRSWQPVNVGTNPQWTSMWFLNNKDGFITSYYNLYRTNDGGKTWISIPEIAGDYLRGMKFTDNKNGYIYGGSYGPLLLVTTDGGNTWDSNYPGYGRIGGIAQSKGGKLISVHENPNGFGRSINFSLDAGKSWEKLDELPGENFTKIDFVTEDVGLLMSANAQYKTVDKGMTWKQLTWSTPLYYFHYFDENNALLSDGYIIYKTSDGGETMEEKLVTTSNPDPYYAPAGQLYAVSDELIFSYSDYALYRSQDAGENWELMTHDYGFYARDMQFLTANVGYRMELFGSVMKTEDGGVNWNLIYERHPLASDVYHSIFFVDENIGYKAGKKFSKTTDGGITWTTIFTNFYGEIFDVYFTDVLHGYVAARSRNLYETFDGGLTWTEIVLGGSSQDGLYGIQYKHGNIYLAGPTGYVSQIKNPSKEPVQPGYAIGPDEVCAGDTHAYWLSENYTGSYQWNVPGASVNDEGALAYVRFPHAGEYTFTIKNFNHCGVSESRTKTVTAIALPVPEISGAEIVESLAPMNYEVTNLDEEFQYIWDVTGAKSFTNEDSPHSTVRWQLETADDTQVRVFVSDPSSGCSVAGSLDVIVDAILAVEDEAVDLITVYPNPTAAEVTIKSRVNEPLGVSLFSTTGVQYFSNELSPTQEYKLQLRHLPAGLYLLEITNRNGDRVTKKLLKQ